MYDITDKLSFDQASFWINDFSEKNEKKYAILMLIGNKIDNVHNRQVNSVEAINLAKNIKCGYFEVSAKENIKISESFDWLISNLIYDNSVHINENT